MRVWTILLASAALAVAVTLLLRLTFDHEKRPGPRKPGKPGKPAQLPRAASPAAIQGRVLAGGKPVAGARVRIRGDRKHVTTDARGAFQLPPPGSIEDRITAAAEGYLIGGTAWRGLAAVQIELRPLPAEDCPEYVWTDPRPDRAAQGRCANCHAEIYRQWSAGPHARAATNRRFRNLYDGSTWSGTKNRGWSLLAEHPDGAGVCSSCHAPTVDFGDPASNDLRQVRGVAALGVHCDFCHKIRDVEVDNAGLTHGRFAASLLRPKSREHQLFFGPLEDVDRGEDAHSPVFQESRYCAICHEGTLFGVAVYTTFHEWLESRAATEGRSCQSCHMRPDGRMTNIAPGHGGIERAADTLASHGMAPGGKLQRLQSCLTLKSEVQGAEVRVVLKAHDVGHAVPTGYIDRHLLLVVEAWDDSDQRVPLQEGSRLDQLAGAALEGLPGRLFGRPLRDAKGNSPAPFWRVADLVADSRIQADQTVTSRFRFAAPPRRVRVRLLYRRFWEATRRQKNWPDDTRVVFDRKWRRDMQDQVRKSAPCQAKTDWGIGEH